MNRLLASLLSAAVAMSVLVASGIQPASLLGPTPVHAAAPATKVDFPEKGKTIALSVPYTAGGGTDLAARLLAPMLEKELGVSVQVVNKPGAGSQRGLSELVRGKPDGYSISYLIVPTVLNTYLDPNRQAIYNRTDFVPLAGQFDLPYVIAVHRDSPYKTLSDLVAAVKAKPDTIKNGTTGLMALGHIATLQFQRTVNLRFALVHFEGSAPQIVALAGQHVDVIFTGQAEDERYGVPGEVQNPGGSCQLLGGYRG
jgi:tripartite-type tricarboxylate transporter receptor subunit TctC